MVFPALLPLAYVPALLERTKTLFLALFQPYVASLIESLSSGGASAGSALKQLKEKIVEERWDEVWERCFRSCEGVRWTHTGMRDGYADSQLVGKEVTKRIGKTECLGQNQSNRFKCRYFRC